MDEIRAITLPKWGLTMEEGTFGDWHVAEGESFHKGQALCTIESSKIVNDMEASFDGTLRRRIAAAGDVLPVGALIAVSAPMETPDADIDAFVASQGGSSQAAAAAAAGQTAGTTSRPAAASTTSQPAAAAGGGQAAATRAVAAAMATTSQSATPVPPGGLPATPGGLIVPPSLAGSPPAGVPATPRARAFAQAHAIDLGRVHGSGPSGRVSLADIATAVTGSGGRMPARPTGRTPVVLRSHRDDAGVAATPVARRLAASRGVNLHDCRATGSRGRVCRADVEEAIQRLEGGRPGRESAPQAGVSPGQVTVNESVAEPLTGMRRTIAQRLQASYQTSPHFRATIDIEMDAALALRSQINETVPGVKVSVNDLVVKASGLALVRVPQVNVQFDEETQTVTRFADADVSVAVSVPEGLITPVVHGVNRRPLGDISAEIADLATRAKARTLTAEQVQGGTFTVSNLGMYGVTSFDAIINPPQAAILAVGAGRRRLVLVDDEVEARTVMEVCLAADHRVVDGALAARFLAELRAILEAPAQMLV